MGRGAGREDGEWLEEGESGGRGGGLLGLFAYRMGDDKDGGRGKGGILCDLFLYSVHGREASTQGEACLVFIRTREFHTEVNKFFVMPFFIYCIHFFMHFMSVFTLYSQNAKDIFEL